MDPRELVKKINLEASEEDLSSSSTDESEDKQDGSWRDKKIDNQLCEEAGNGVSYPTSRYGRQQRQSRADDYNNDFLFEPLIRNRSVTSATAKRKDGSEETKNSGKKKKNVTE